ncbi:prevent-host-death protein [Salipiger aestuarii]|uniref:Antitoxin n=1 Tax=Salipiger aestuarii TaxID=568098 RepID=A0A327Y2T2_9RHOB|nr:type II toxin-antitoxin system prevent-host-death family antitoxin [Salipiger aestuarii]KAB2536273.1 prevent-host-death protein [Salipiger aestuarii]RAK14065.1 prevent-host-death family protein [Salipiger aestuarii]
MIVPALNEAALSGHPQQVTRRGKPAVVVLSVEEYHRLVQAARSRRGSFQDHLLAFPSDDLPRAEVLPRDVAF